MCWPFAVRFQSSAELRSGDLTIFRSPQPILGAPAPLPASYPDMTFDQATLRTSIVPPGPAPVMPDNVSRPAGRRIVAGGSVTPAPGPPGAPSRPGSPFGPAGPAGSEAALKSRARSEWSLMSALVSEPFLTSFPVIETAA